MKIKAIHALSAVLAAIFIISFISQSVCALTYNGSSSYKSGPYYTKLCEVEITGDKRTDIVNIAKSQIGYFEGGKSTELSGTVNGSGNYTEYGRWYGMQDMWCAIFVSWCAYVANVPTSVIPKHAFTPDGLKWFQTRGRAYSRADVAAGLYTPQPGDIIYFKSSRNNNPTNHVGIVTDYKHKTVYTVEGNSSLVGIDTNGGAVANKTHSISDTYIVYICRPDYEEDESCRYLNACLDEYEAVKGGVKVRGWCFDTRDTSVSLNVYVSVGAPLSDSEADISTETVANTSRPDVDNVYGCGSSHGFNNTVETAKTGKQAVYVYAVNPDTNEKNLISVFSANIPAPDDPTKKKADINGDGFLNNKDIVALFRYVSYGEKTDEQHHDFNGDGEANNKDVIALFRFISTYKG